MTKSENINVRVTSRIKTQLQCEAEKNDMSYPDFMRKLVFHVCSETGIPNDWVNFTGSGNK